MESVSIMKFGRVLLSEYSTAYGIDNYLNYKDLKRAANDLQGKPPAQVLTLCEEAFFKPFSNELSRVRDFYRRKEAEVVEQLSKIQSSSAVELSTKQCVIFEAYIQLHLLNAYRTLNFFGLKKLLEKFTRRIAHRSVSLQSMCDEKYNDMLVLQETSLDIAQGMEFLVKVLMQSSGPRSPSVSKGDAFVKPLNYEEARISLEGAVSRDYRCRPRILQNTMAAFFRPNKIPRREGKYKCRVISGTTNTRLAHAIDVLMGHKDHAQHRVAAFANGEVDVEIKENVIGDDVFVVQSFVSSKDISCSTAVIEVLLVCNALRLEGARRITAVVPYMGYATGTHGNAIATMLSTCGVQHVITVDLGVDQAEGYFTSIPVENVYARRELVKYVLNSFSLEHVPVGEVVVVSSDSHSVSRARAFADSLSKAGNVGVGLVTSFIPPPPEEPLLVGSVVGKHCVVVDTVIDEGILLGEVTKLLLKSGALSVKAVATHGIFSGNAADIVANSGIQEVIVTDSLPYDNLLLHPTLADKIRIVPIAPLLAECIERVHMECTLSVVFDK